jgi:hypothetical protein
METPTSYRARDRKIRSRTHGLSTPGNIAIAVGVVVTAVLIFELGIWYFFAMLGLYAAIDIVHRLEERRNARLQMAILASADHDGRDVLFVGSARKCQEAAWLAKGLGWLACPMVQQRPWRHSVRLKQVPGATQLRALLQGLNEQRLAARIRLPGNARTFGQRLAEQTFQELGSET